MSLDKENLKIDKTPDNLENELNTKIEELTTPFNKTGITLVIIKLIFATTLFTFIAMSSSENNNGDIPRYTLLNQLQVTIANGGELTELSRILADQNISFLDRVRNFDFSKTYKSNVKLSTVLLDLKIRLYSDIDYHIKNKQYYDKDGFKSRLENLTSLISKVDKLYIDNNKINPFNKLEKNQRIIFESIKLHSKNYSLISGDLEKVSDELHSKNQLVTTYLSTSNISFWISIFALVFSIATGLYQLYSSRESNLIKIHLNALSRHSSTKQE